MTDRAQYGMTCSRFEALLAEALGLPDAHIFRIDQKFAALNIIDWFGEIPLVKLVNG